MIDYSNASDPNYDPYWGDEETSYSEAADYPDLSDSELEELAADYIQEMREDGALRLTVVRPGKKKPETEDVSPVDQPDEEISF